MQTPLTRRGFVGGVGALVTLGARNVQAQSGTLDTLLSQRRMVRRFRLDPITDDVVRRLLHAATRAPSAGHTQPWAFIVVRDPQRRAQLGRAAHGQSWLADAPVVIVACADLARSRQRYGDRGERYGIIDTAFASLLLLLAVAEEHLGACFVGAFRDSEVKQLLAIPATVMPIALIPIGYPAERPSPSRRRPLADMIYDERWGMHRSPSSPTDATPTG